MRRVCKLLALLAMTLLFCLIAVIGRLGLFLSPAAEKRFLAHATRWWSQSMALIIGLHVLHDFQPGKHPSDIFFIVANHQSYLDVVVIGSIFATLFVAKSDVRRWPILGWLVTLGGPCVSRKKSLARGGGGRQRNRTNTLARRQCASISRGNIDERRSCAAF